MSHADAALPPRARLRLAQLVVDHAKIFMVSARTAENCADRYQANRAAGMTDRSSRPHSSPTKHVLLGLAALLGWLMARIARSS